MKVTLCWISRYVVIGKKGGIKGKREDAEETKNQIGLKPQQEEKSLLIPAINPVRQLTDRDGAINSISFR